MSHVQNANPNNIPVRNLFGKVLTNVTSNDSLYDVLVKVATACDRTVKEIVLFATRQDFAQSKVRWSIHPVEGPKLLLTGNISLEILNKAGLLKAEDSDQDVNEAALKTIKLSDFAPSSVDPITSIGAINKPRIVDGQGFIQPSPTRDACCRLM